MTIPPPDASPAPPAFLADPPAPLDGFPPEEFKARRDKLRAACPDGIILLRGSTEDQFTNPAVYHQNSSFFYLTGVDTPGAHLVLFPKGFPVRDGMRDEKDAYEEALFLPARNATTETWTGAQLGPGEETQKATGIEKVFDSGKLWSAMTQWIRRSPILYTLTPYGESASLSRENAMMQKVAALAPAVQFRDCAMPLAHLRMIKSTLEIERMKQAIGITMQGQKIAEEMITEGAGRFEYEVEARIFETFRSRGAAHAFAPIVGSGIRSTVLHYEHNDHKMEAGDVVVVDIGAKIGHYCGDITRTYSVGGVFSPRQQEIYDQVQNAMNFSVSSYKPGEDTLRTISDKVKDYLKESPLRSKNEKGEEMTMENFMPHGLGHHLGLDVHDVSDAEIPLVPGNVITIEPGIYLPGEKIGVRIENDYLVTETGLVVYQERA